MENTFNLKSFLAEGKLLKEEQEGNIVDFLNQHYDEAFEKIAKPAIDLGIKNGEEYDDVDNYEDYIKGWFLSSTPGFEGCAEFIVETLHINAGFMASFKPFPRESMDVDDQEAEAVNTQPKIIAGEKIYVFEYSY